MKLTDFQYNLIIGLFFVIVGMLVLFVSIEYNKSWLRLYRSLYESGEFFIISPNVSGLFFLIGLLLGIFGIYLILNIVVNNE